MERKLTRLISRLLPIILFLCLHEDLRAQVAFSVDSVRVFGVSSLEKYWNITEPYLDNSVDEIIEYGPALHIYGILNNCTDRPLVINGIPDDDSSDFIGITVIIKYNVDGRQISQRVHVFDRPRQVHHGKTTLDGIIYNINYIGPGEIVKWDFVVFPYSKKMKDKSKMSRQDLVKQGLEFESQLKLMSTNITVDIGGIIKY